jgi:hypothetical protein
MSWRQLSNGLEELERLHLLVMSLVEQEEMQVMEELMNLHQVGKEDPVVWRRWWSSKVGSSGETAVGGPGEIKYRFLQVI